MSETTTSQLFFCYAFMSALLRLISLLLYQTAIQVRAACSAECHELWESSCLYVSSAGTIWQLLTTS